MNLVSRTNTNLLITDCNFTDGQENGHARAILRELNACVLPETNFVQDADAPK